MRGLARGRSRAARTPRRAPSHAAQVRAKTSLVISIAMSQRTPSHCAPTSISSLGDRVAQRGRERVELDDVRPRREVRDRGRGRRSRRPSRRNAAGSRARSSSVPADEVARGAPSSHGMVGRDVVGHVVEDQPEPARGELARAARAPPGRRSARRRRSRARSTASRSRRRRRRSGSAARKPAIRPGSLERDRQPGRAALARRPSARPRRPAAPRARPTPRAGTSASVRRAAAARRPC